MQKCCHLHLCPIITHSRIIFFKFMSKQPIGRFIVILGPQAYKDDSVERGLYKLHC